MRFQMKSLYVKLTETDVSAIVSHGNVVRPSCEETNRKYLSLSPYLAVTKNNADVCNAVKREIEMTHNAYHYYVTHTLDITCVSLIYTKYTHMRTHVVTSTCNKISLQRTNK